LVVDALIGSNVRKEDDRVDPILAAPLVARGVTAIGGDQWIIAAGQTAALVFAVLLVLVGGYYLMGGQRTGK